MNSQNINSYFQAKSNNAQNLLMPSQTNNISPNNIPTNQGIVQYPRYNVEYNSNNINLANEQYTDKRLRSFIWRMAAGFSIFGLLIILFLFIFPPNFEVYS